MKVTYEMYQRACAKYAEHGDMQDALETALAELPDPSETVLELNKRITALQMKLERVRDLVEHEYPHARDALLLILRGDP